MTLTRLADTCYLAALLTMPLAGVGVIHVLTGHDVGAGLQPAYLCLAVAIALRAAMLGTRRGRDGVVARWRAGDGRGLVKAGGLVALALGVSALGIVRTPAVGSVGQAWPRYVRQVIQVGVMAGFVLYPALWTRGDGRWRTTLTALLVVLAGQEIYALLQGVAFVHPLPGYAAIDRLATSNPAILSGSPELYLAGMFRGVPRLRGTMCEPLYLGSLLLAILPVLALTLHDRRCARLVWALGCMLLVATWSRGAILAAGVAVVVWLVLRRRGGLPLALRSLLLVGLASLVALAVVAAVIAGPDALLWPVKRLLQSFDRGDWSNLTRMYSMQAGWRAFLASPLVGVGWGQFAFHFPLLVDAFGLQSQFSWPVVNNFPLEVLCETGLAGFVVLVLLSWQPLRTTWRLLPRADGAARLRIVATATAAVGVAVQLLTFSQYNLPHLGIALGLWLAALQDVRDREANR